MASVVGQNLPSHDHSARDVGLECDGSHVSSKKGSWKGHVLPGVTFIVWGAWWAYSCITFYLWRSARRPYRGRAWYPCGLFAGWLWFLEPVLKVAVPAVAVTMELLVDHDPMAYRYLYCPEGTKYAGRFALSHLNNWQHAASYPAIVMSGLVDMAARFVPLPAGTCQALLGSAFGVMAFLMGTHEKHEPQDKIVHWLLFVAMALCTVMVFLEMTVRRSVLVGMGKAAALIFQGAWLIQIAAVEFEGRPQWSEAYGGGTMFAPAAFSFILVLTLACMLAFYALLALLSRRSLLPRSSLLPPLESEEWQEEKEQERGGLLPRHHHHHHHRYDSANASDDNETTEGEQLLALTSSRKPRGDGAGDGVVSLQLAATGADTAYV